MSSVGTRSLGFLPLCPMTWPIPLVITGERCGVRMMRLRKAASGRWGGTEYTIPRVGRGLSVSTCAVRSSTVLGHYTSPMFLKRHKRALKSAFRSILGYVLHQDRDKPPSIITFSPMVPTFLPDPMTFSSSRDLAGDDRNTPTAVNLGLITSHIAIQALNEDNVRLLLKLDVDPEILYTGYVWCLTISLHKCVMMLLYIFCIRRGWILRAGILRSYADGPC